MSTSPEFVAGMRRLRRRRLFLWVMIAVYLPMIWLVLEISQSDRVTGLFFAGWVVLVGVAANLTAFCRCPQCGNFFHLNGVVPLYLRHCLHCGLHISGDPARNAFERRRRP
ncbi:hypothetical protein [Desulfuromonas thiophila]|uniref:Uncharacterized protein n=1 Tax=Desulfuromonas thiophila TaxID=57664 RepID=A0A1G7CCM0_9BACT|nr:hypothetical protein [Desulfuromonas thiophila]SDE36480.1 hypothetical protein SAMN05661003_10919 [Desulfuromonas thiophila]